jgi:hypothetical protein
MTIGNIGKTDIHCSRGGRRAANVASAVPNGRAEAVNARGLLAGPRHHEVRHDFGCGRVLGLGSAC